MFVPLMVVAMKSFVARSVVSANVAPVPIGRFQTESERNGCNVASRVPAGVLLV